jgi:peptidoglycan/LPS O-acetylase OafA/YrhL
MQRINWLDLLKGIAILAIICYHTNTGDNLKQISNIAISAFFFASGYLLWLSEKNSFKQLAKKRFFSIIIPYFVFGLFSIAITTIIIKKNISVDYFFELLKALLYHGTMLKEFYNGPLWFIGPLFFGQLIFFLITKTAKKNNTIITGIIFFAILDFLKEIFFPTIELPWETNRLFEAVVLIGTGYLAHKNKKSIKEQLKKSNWLAITITSATMTILGIAILESKMLPTTELFLINYFTRFLGVLFFVMLSIKIKRIGLTKPIRYIGENSMVFFAGHFPIMTASYGIKKYFFLLNNNTIFETLMVPTVIFFLWFASKEINKHAPWVAGKKTIKE